MIRVEDIIEIFMNYHTKWSKKMDIVHTNEERIEKIRCLLQQVDNICTRYREGKPVAWWDSLPEDNQAAEECLDALKQFMADHNTLDCI